MPKKSKPPKKPYKDFPLFPHAVGQWAKKIRRKIHYFGVWADPDAALKKYLGQRDDLHAGRTPRLHPDGLTVAGLCNHFLTAKKAKMDAGELSPRTWSDYYTTAENILATFDKSAAVDQLVPADFARLRAALAKTRGPVALGNEIQRVRTVFKFAFANDLIDRPARLGLMFEKPSRKAIRKARHEAGPRMLEADALRRVIAAAGTPMKAMILLGLNAGFGQTDIASLTLKALDLKGGWVNFPRPKTAIARRCPLWPETVEAIHEALAVRPMTKDEADAELAFVTKYGARWVRVRQREGKAAVVADAVRLEFVKLLRDLNLTRRGLGFYALRHVFRTVADASKDQPAVNAIMGHADESMAAFYRERIDDDRLKAVAEVVRAWLFCKSEPPMTPAT